MGKMAKARTEKLSAMPKKILIIFTKNPILGKAKSRLAETVGQHNALLVFKELLAHTVSITAHIECEKRVYFSDEIVDNSYFSDSIYDKRIQKGNDLGERMRNACVEATDDGFDQVVLIGSDCYELTQSEIEKAFSILTHSDFVFGPAQDGGYYLIGTRTTFTKVFDNKTWSTSTVLYEAIRDVEGANLSHGELATLSDVDYEGDLGELKDLLQ